MECVAPALNEKGSQPRGGTVLLAWVQVYCSMLPRIVPVDEYGTVTVLLPSIVRVAVELGLMASPI